MQDFVHLHVHSSYSIMDGLSPIKELVAKAHKDGMRGIALTDHGVMYGIKQFADIVSELNGSINKSIKENKAKVKAIRDNNNNPSDEEQRQIEELEREIAEKEKQLFKPIYGCEAYCARRTIADKDSKVPSPYKPSVSIDRSGWHLILLAKNKQGYNNLIKLISIANTEGFYFKPRIDKNLLEQYHEGIIVLSACLGGEIPQHILGGNPDLAEESARWFKSVFGDDFYLEVQLHRTDNPDANQDTYKQQLEVNEKIYDIAQRLDIKVVATNDVHFAKEEDAAIHDRMLCVNTSVNLDDKNRLRYSQQEWLKSQKEMNEIFGDKPELLSNSLEILDKVEFYSIENPPLMPDFPIPEEFSGEDEYLRYLTYEGAKERYGDPIPENVTEQIDFELETIKMMKFPGYFLIVQDFIQAARNLNITVGPGRGSAAGSTVAYCLKITNMDPLKYGLLFERFLNPDRTSLPDIDIDFDDEGRSRILEWVTEKYGKDNVAHIISFQEWKAKSALKDNARLEGIPLNEINKITKMIPSKLSEDDIKQIKDIPEVIEDIKKHKNKPTITKSIALFPKLKELANGNDPKMRRLFKYGAGMEGGIRSTGLHACGIIIGNTEISNIVPTTIAADTKKKDEKFLTTQYDGKYIESTGLIKMDFLGLRTLSIINKCVALIKKRHNIDIVPEELPLDDAPTYELFCNADTQSVFQFESAGMRKYLKELKPDKFELLIAMVALYRPGPMKNIPTFIARRHGREPVSYEIPETQTILQETYGVTVYQEQVMQLSRLLANFTRGESDDLRSAMGKKKMEKLDKLMPKFLSEGVKNGHPHQLLLNIWENWKNFASYAFNKSHAACYAWLSYQTGYLKAHYPAEFMAANMSCNLDAIKEITSIIQACLDMGLSILPPNINESGFEFTVNDKGQICFGLKAIKGISESAVRAIIKEREEGGEFKDIFDFFVRMAYEKLNSQTLQALAGAGAFDCLQLPREVYFAPSVEDSSKDFLVALVNYGRKKINDKTTSTNNLFGDVVELEIPRPEIPAVEIWSDSYRFFKEQGYVGVSLSGSVLDPYAVVLKGYCNTSISETKELDNLPVHKTIAFSGIVSKYEEKVSKKGNPYVNMTIEDYTGSNTFYLNDYKKLNASGFIKEGAIILCLATIEVSPYRGDKRITFTKIQDLTVGYKGLFDRIVITLIADDLKESVVDFPEDGAEDGNVEEIELATYMIEDLSTEIEECFVSSSGEGEVHSIDLIFNIKDRSEMYSVRLTLKDRKIVPSVSLLNFLEERNIKYHLE